MGRASRRSAVLATIAAIALAVPAVGSAGTQSPHIARLDEPRFNASGRGEVTTRGTIEKGSTVLGLEDASTWAVSHGIRVQRAGTSRHVNDGTGWTSLHPAVTAGSSGGAEAYAECAMGPSAPSPVDACGISFAPAGFLFDELRLLIWSSRPTTPAEFEIELMFGGGDVTFGDMEVPALLGETWTEVYLPIEGLQLGGVTEVRFHCETACADTTVRLDELILLTDLITSVTAIEPGGGGDPVLHLAAKAGTSGTFTVFHDDTEAVEAWLKEAQSRPAGTVLLAPKGVYYVSSVGLPSIHRSSRSLPLYNDLHLRCLRPGRAVFKNSGGSATGLSNMARSADDTPSRITIQGCTFDSNGYNREDFHRQVTIQPAPRSTGIGSKIVFRNNAFIDSDPPGDRGCDHTQDACAVHQRVYVEALRVRNVTVEGNLLRGGGRIKLGGRGSGEKMYVRRNVIDLVNDNAITIVAKEAGVTKDVEITDNLILNPLATGIFFGGDGAANATVPGMLLENVTIARNTIVGFFTTAGIKGDLPETVRNVTIQDNVVISQRARPAAAGHIPKGIHLERPASFDPALATGIAVTGNSILAAGDHAVFDPSAIFLDGPSRGTQLEGNTIGCSPSPCDRTRFERGIFLRTGPIEDATIRGNVVSDAGGAITVGSLTVGSIATRGLTIEGNTLRRSRVGSGGQISLLSRSPSVIEALVRDNTIEDGAGYGIVCAGPGIIDLTLGANAFIGHDGTEVNGCALGGEKDLVVVGPAGTSEDARSQFGTTCEPSGTDGSCWNPDDQAHSCTFQAVVENQGPGVVDAPFDVSLETSNAFATGGLGAPVVATIDAWLAPGDRATLTIHDTQAGSCSFRPGMFARITVDAGEDIVEVDELDNVLELEYLG